MKKASAQPADQVADLVAMIAHDVRSPITAIKGFSQLALRQPELSSQVRDCLNVVINESNRIASMVDDLVFLTQLGDRAMIKAGAAQFSEIVQAAIERSRRLDPNTEVVLEIQATTDVVVQCEPSSTGRALALMIGTARKYCSGSERITVSLRSSEAGLIVAVLPDGKVAADKLPALRRLVGRGPEEESDDLSPSGLGLFICRRLIDAQGGRVWIEEPPDDCTHFMIMLPGQLARHQKPPRGDCQQWS